MTKYKVKIIYETVKNHEKYYTVEADSLEEAEDMAEEIVIKDYNLYYDSWVQEVVEED